MNTTAIRQPEVFEILPEELRKIIIEQDLSEAFYNKTGPLVPALFCIIDSSKLPNRKKEELRHFVACSLDDEKSLWTGEDFINIEDKYDIREEFKLWEK
jgi:hypothetical protein